ncbi:LemA family protein [Candidatus Micrarchaeota archaeon]|nr:LemA family protein [Candidatus Micrarchaeota archaeon]
MLASIAIVVVVIVALGVILVFNSLITARNRVKNAWAQIDVQLKKRADLVYNLAEVVKGYSKHEKNVFEEVTKRRTGILGSSSQDEVIAQSNALSASMKSVFAVAEAYPELKANQGYLDLQRQLVSLEDGIARARMVYNDVVTIYNTRIATFPQNILAPPLGFGETGLLETDAIDRLAVKVKL